jgi:hypothetical protein
MYKMQRGNLYKSDNKEEVTGDQQMRYKMISSLPAIHYQWAMKY